MRHIVAFTRHRMQAGVFHHDANFTERFGCIAGARRCVGKRVKMAPLRTLDAISALTSFLPKKALPPVAAATVLSDVAAQGVIHGYTIHVGC